MAKIAPAPLTRSLSTIAHEIEADYRAQGKPVYFAAVPYVQAMRSLDGLGDSFGHDDAEGIVIRALGNLSTWRGETAKRVREELKAGLAWHQQEKRR